MISRTQDERVTFKSATSLVACHFFVWCALPKAWNSLEGVQWGGVKNKTENVC